MPNSKLPGLATRQSANSNAYYVPMNYDLGGYMMLPEHGFGSWLKENAGGLFKGAGSLVSLIPGLGQIAGPILNLAGAAVTGSQQRKADKELVAQQQKDIDTKVAADQKLQMQQDLAVRNENLFGGQTAVNYGSTFAYGGDLMMNPQIVDYSDKADKHSEGIGGVPVDAKGNPATTSRMSAVGMTEAGEVAWNGYIFSNKLKVK